MYKIFGVVVGFFGVFFSIISAFLHSSSSFLIGILISLTICFAFFAVDDLIENLKKIAKKSTQENKQDFPLGYASKEEYEKQVQFENMFK